MHLSGAPCQRFCSSQIKSATARRQTHSDNIRIHPYRRQLNDTASSWPELRDCTAAYDFDPTPSQSKVICNFCQLVAFLELLKMVIGLMSRMGPVLETCIFVSKGCY